LADNDEARYTVDLLQRWKQLAEASALLSVEGVGASSPTQVSDVDLITFYAQCFDRPAFQDAFRQEGSMEAFDKAIGVSESIQMRKFKSLRRVIKVHGASRSIFEARAWGYSWLAG
jgi:hypothetical protein